jgi:hypothetical protein
MNGRQALVLGVDHRDGGDEHAGREHERQRDGGRAERAGLEEAEPHRELRRGRPGHRLREPEPLAVLGLGEPLALLDEIALHVPNERDRSTEPRGTEPKEVPNQTRQRPRPARGPLRTAPEDPPGRRPTIDGGGSDRLVACGKHAVPERAARDDRAEAIPPDLETRPSPSRAPSSVLHSAHIRTRRSSTRRPIGANRCNAFVARGVIRRG